MTENYRSESPSETMELGARFAKRHVRPGTVVTLFGELGAGKTQFVKGIARACGIDDRELTSPTFALANEYICAFPDNEPGTLYHLDCYRFEKPEELLQLGLEDYLLPKRGATVIEWADRIERYLPQTRIDVHILFAGENERHIVVEQLHESGD